MSIETNNLQNEASRIMIKYPDRLPLIVTKKENSELPEIPKRKFLVPRNMLCAELKYIISKYIIQTQDGLKFSEKSIYIYITGHNYSPKASDLISDIYEQYHNEDNFLYINYSGENTLGN
jgi:GABA(A) receptor-associated protein